MRDQPAPFELQDVGLRTMAVRSMGLRPVPSVSPARVWASGYPEQDLVGVAAVWVGDYASGWVRTKPASRGLGHGVALLDHMLEYARRSRCTAFRPIGSVSGESAAWLSRHGGRRRSCIREFEAPLEAVGVICQRIWPRVAPSVPESAELVTLGQAAQRGYLDELSGFVAPAIGGRPQRWLERVATSLKRGDGEVDPDVSGVLLVDGRARGALLIGYRETSGWWVTESIVVAPQLRGGWANAWLRLHCTRAALATGRTPTLRFQARDDQTDTLRFARHISARLIEERFLMEVLL